MSPIERDLRPRPATWADAQRSIIVRLRDTFHDKTRDLWLRAAKVESPSDAAPTWPLTQRHEAELVCRTADGEVLELAASDLARWRVTVDDAFRQAWQNLVPTSERVVSVLAPDVFRVSWNDGLDVARASNPAYLAGLPIRGAPVVMAPAHTTLLVTGSETVDSMRAVLDPLAARLHDDPTEPWFSQPFLWRAQQAELLGWPALTALGDWRAVVQYVECQLQRPLWDAIMGPNVFVAGVVLARRSDGLLVSISAYGDVGGEGALLQDTDYVRIVVGPAKAPTRKIWSTWHKIVSVLEESVREQEGSVPRRLQITRFPSDAELDAVAIEPLELAR